MLLRQAFYFFSGGGVFFRYFSDINLSHSYTYFYGIIYIKTEIAQKNSSYADDGIESPAIVVSVMSVIDFLLPPPCKTDTDFVFHKEQFYFLRW